MKHLLDVNFLVASIWASHTHHTKAMAWLPGKTIVLCPIAELGYLRLSTHKKILNAPMADTRKLLEKFIADHDAEKIPDDLDALNSHPKTSEQVTDHYLTNLATKHGLKLATFDRQIAHPAVEFVS